MRREILVTAADGTSLFVDDRGPTGTGHVPILCLPGLTRNSRDFEPVFELLEEKRRIIAMDLRGRGCSSFAADPASYTPATELQDVLGVLDQLGIPRVALIGTSRGGIVGMLWAATARERLAGLLLNDVGPELNPDGLLRIADFVGKPVSYGNWDEAARGFSAGTVGFSGVNHAQWRAAVKRIYAERDGRIVHSHDLALASTLPTRNAIQEGQVPDLWQLVPALEGMPLTLLRGAGSDLLTEATVRKMASRVGGLTHVPVPNRGHVPFLDEPESVMAIEQWLASVDKNEKGR